MYDFDSIIDRRHDPSSYSMKWGNHKLIANMLGINEITDDSIAVFTADMDFRCAPKIIEALHKVADHGIFGYSMMPEDRYWDSIINWFSRRHGWEIKREELVYVNGTVEAVKQIILAFTNPGDGVIISRPVYGPFTTKILETRRKVVNNQMIEGEDLYYTLDFDDLEQKCADPNNKLYILCNPQNPSGRIYTNRELIKLAEICKKHNVIIAADEIHGDLIRRDAKFTPIAMLADNDNIITATAVNKTFNLAGLHCTHLVITNPELRARFQQSLGFVMPTPFTIAAVMAAYNESEDWLEELKTYIDGTIDWVMDFLHTKMPKVKVRKPDGTYIVWMDFRGCGLSPAEVHDRIYNKARVLLESGPMFDPDRGAGFERICLPSPRSVIKEAFERIAARF